MVGRLSAGLSDEFWKNRRVLLTGHTGFKGAWTALLLDRLGAETTGIALAAPTTPSLFEILKPWRRLNSVLCDIRHREQLDEAICAANPEIVIHMAAQPLVRRSYRDPLETIETNVMGTVHLLESLRRVQGLKAVLVVTSDKVYENQKSTFPLAESSPLGGHDPYSASKAATELVAAAYARSFYADRDVAIKTARAGNVIGGGDWARDRIVPDLWRAYESKLAVELRHPEAVRPWQHVLDPLYGYLLYIERMVDDRGLPPALNFGPGANSNTTVLQLAEHFAAALGAKDLWTVGEADEQLHENKLLNIDPSLAGITLGWRSVLDVDRAVRWTGDWYKAFRDGHVMRTVSIEQIEAYSDLLKDARG